MKRIIIPPPQICCVCACTCVHMSGAGVINTALPLCWGFPGGASGKDPAYRCRRCKRSRLDPWVRKIPWRRAWPPTPVFLPGESHGQRSLAGYSPWGRKELDMTEATHAHVIYQLNLQMAIINGNTAWQMLWVDFIYCTIQEETTLSIVPQMFST